MRHRSPRPLLDLLRLRLRAPGPTGRRGAIAAAAVLALSVGGVVTASETSEPEHPSAASRVGENRSGPAVSRDGGRKPLESEHDGPQSGSPDVAGASSARPDAEASAGASERSSAGSSEQRSEAPTSSRTTSAPDEDDTEASSDTRREGPGLSVSSTPPTSSGPSGSAAGETPTGGATPGDDADADDTGSPGPDSDGSDADGSDSDGSDADGWDRDGGDDGEGESDRGTEEGSETGAGGADDTPETYARTVSGEGSRWQVSVAADEAATFVCSLDGGPVEPCSAMTSLDGLTSESHTLAVRAVDADGNRDETPAVLHWTPTEGR